MRIVNKTNYETNDLKKLFTATLKVQNAVEGKLSLRQRKSLTVEIVYSRFNAVSNTYSGYAYLHGVNMRLRLPKVNILPRNVACLFDHELMHIRGYKHGNIARGLKSSHSHFDFAEKFTIKRKEPKALKPKEDIQLKRHGQVLKNLKIATTRYKRAQTIYKKWTAKKKYYERVLTAAGKLPE